MMFESSLFEGTVMHARKRPKQHRLRYNVFSMLVDLDELPKLDRTFALFGYNRWAPLSFFDRDHGALADAPLRPWVENHLSEAGLAPDGGSIRLLCYPRVFGYVFNPLSVYFCYAATGQLRAILYEVCNTFQERHTYVIPVQETGRTVVTQRCHKALYVSPFVTMDSHYRFSVVPPGDSVHLAIRQEDEGGLLLAASFQGVRRTMSSSALGRVLLRFPLLTIKIMAGIHWEALRLWLKGVPALAHHPAANRVQSSIVDSTKQGT